MNATDTRPRRLVLSPTELELVRRRAGDVALPPDFQLGYDTRGNGKDPQEALAEAARALARTDAVSSRPPESVVPLEALEQVGPASSLGADTVVEQVVGELGLGMEQARVVGVLDRQACGLLHCLVIRPSPTPKEPARVGQVLWFATSSGWIGAKPEPGPQGERLVRLIPVDRADIGAWLAPVVAGVLE